MVFGLSPTPFIRDRQTNDEGVVDDLESDLKRKLKIEAGEAGGSEEGWGRGLDEEEHVKPVNFFQKMKYGQIE